MLAVSSAWLKLIATNEIAPRLYTSSGWAISTAATSDGRSARSPGIEIDVGQLVAQDLGASGCPGP